MSDSSQADPPGFARSFRIPIFVVAQQALVVPAGVVLLGWLFLFSFGRRNVLGTLVLVYAVSGVLFGAWWFWRNPHRFETKDGVLTATFVGGRRASWPLSVLWRRSTPLGRVLAADEVMDEAGRRAFFLSRHVNDLNVLRVAIKAEPHHAA
jgi:hypothetical protein